MTQKLFILAGDGIGPEVMAEAEKVVAWFNTNFGGPFEVAHGLVGGASYDVHGEPLTDYTLGEAMAADAVLFGAIGGPKWEGADVPYDLKPERGLLRLRKEMGLFANLRPAVCFDALKDASTLRPDVVGGLDLMIVRELIGGIYFGEPRAIENLPNGEQKGFDTQVYTTSEIQRVARVAFDLARVRGKKLCSVDKANVMKSGVLWRDVVTKLQAAEYPDIQLSHMYVDNCAMQLVRNPKQFDVIVTDNLFGDILSDLASMATGSLGMLQSAALGTKDATGRVPSMYEPCHGSAPDIAGKGLANPLATILSFAMALKYSLGRPEWADLVEAAVSDVLTSGIRTGDIMAPGCSPVGTAGMGDAVIDALNARNN